ncbi:MOP flippase family protein [Candidatus Viridilinea mediisalina]|uniref:Colanic acid exporter n=1 Tax=Candidatus Viridilinea mediisalina TaxID=2024553 RepID=A0A2A6RL27_9CHLR|nr:MOP flippase family protein [Candidatus Viridilinea mediisalina]PDW03606.1 colanic acid exporter [Candidatus Viridilinea mediisalina]
MSLRLQAFSGVRWTTLATVVTTTTQLLQLVVLARLLAPEAFGLMAMVMVMIGFAQSYADAGISSAIVHRQDITSKQLSSLYWLNIMVGVVIFVILWILTPFIARLFNESQLIALLHAVIIIFLIVPLGKQYEVLLQKNLNFNLLARQEIIAAIISTSLAISCAFVGMGVWSLVIGQISLVLTRTLMLLWVGMQIHRPSIHFCWQDLQGYWQFGLYQVGERNINFLAQRIDQLLIGGILGAQALGYYSFAFNLVSLPQNRINPIVTKVAFPTFAKIQDDIPRLQRGYLSVLKMLTLINAPLLIGMIVLAPMFVPLIFGEQWLPSMVLVQLAAIVSLMRGIGNPVGSLLLARGRADLGFKWNLGLFLFSAPFIYVSALWGDVVTVAATWVLLQVILKLPAYLWLIRPLIGPCGKAYIGATAVPIGLASIMGVIVWLGLSLSSISWLSMLSLIALGGSVYVVILWIAERKMLVDLGDLVLGSRNPLNHKKVSFT